VIEVSDNSLIVDDELREICREILAQKWSESQWAAHEADDWFQTPHYSGGFDATEGEFCFGATDATGTEWWFQFPLSAVTDVLANSIKSFPCRPAS